MKWLLTGFEPFGGDSVNSSWRSPMGGESVCLPCVFSQSLPALGQAASPDQDDLGSLGGRVD